METTDPFLWLEDVHGPEALKWVQAQNLKSQGSLKQSPQYAANEAAIKQILLATDRLPQVTYHGGYLYNFWQDEHNKHGLWRRATIEEYERSKPTWELVLDLDALSLSEGEDWVWKGASFLAPKEERCLVWLSRGGLDASVGREFDLNVKSFIPAGFFIPEAKSEVAWLNQDTLLIATDFGPQSLTTSGYARQIRRWKRGEELAQAQILFEGQSSDMGVMMWTEFDASLQRTYVVRNMTFYACESWTLNTDGVLEKTAKPDDAYVVHFSHGQEILQLRGAWKGFTAGSVLALKADGSVVAIFQPSEKQSVTGVHRIKGALIINYIESIQGKVLKAWPDNMGTWQHQPLAFPEQGDLTVTTTDTQGDLVMANYQSHLTPPSIFSLRQGRLKPAALKTLPARFDSSRFQVEQCWFQSKDGTEVPYFFIGPKGLQKNGRNPVLIYGYGGFEVALTPSYLSVTGKVWLEKGGCFAVANIRGGGEFGPKWHEAALKENRQRAFDDFQGVAEDLIARKISQPERMAISGRSNGGLLVGTCYTQRPELFKAVVCGVPLLDMLRYNKLLAGASWMAEYGNPDVPEEREYLLRYSPYQNLVSNKRYPEVFFYTSTTDDRVHPGHARKMAALMEEKMHPFLYFENTAGGHAGSADPGAEAEVQSLIYTFLQTRLL